MRGGTHTPCWVCFKISTRTCSLGSARFLKTVKCRHRNGYLVVKVFIKPDPGMSLRKYHRRLKGTCQFASFC